MKPLICVSLILILAATGFSVPAQTNSVDLPPSPFSLPATTGPQSASYSRDAGQAMESHMTSTNLEVRKIVLDIRSQAKQLAWLQSEAYRKDPLLLTCDQYIGKTHDWVMEQHHAAMDAEASFFYSTNPAEAGRLQKLENDLSHLMNLILLKELGGNTNFSPLIKSVFYLSEELHKGDTNSAVHPEQQYYPYWQCDYLISYHKTHNQALTRSFVEIQSEIGKRYDLLLAKVAQIQQEQNIPPDAVAGVKYGELYRLLDGAAEMYLDVRTPPELRKTREDLSRKFVQLHQLEK